MRASCSSSIRRAASRRHAIRASAPSLTCCHLSRPDVPILRFWLAHRTELATLVAQHVRLVAISTIAAAAIGIPAGVLASRRPRLGRAILVAAGLAQTIPSLALLGFLLPVPVIGGIGPRTALVALAVYAL